MACPYQERSTGRREYEDGHEVEKNTICIPPLANEHHGQKDGIGASREDVKGRPYYEVRNVIVGVDD